MKEQVDAVRQMQEYIDEHLYDTITPADLANASHYSPWHAYRLFTQCLGRTPWEYIRRFRLARSALQLRDESITVTDAAFRCGFGSVDGYRRAFHREFGCNPRQYAKKPVPVYLFTPYRAQDTDADGEEKQRMEKVVKTVLIQELHKPARKMLVRRGKAARDYYAYCEEVGCDIWGLLLSIPDATDEPMGLWLPERLRRPGTSEYIQGVEVAPDYANVPEGLELLDLPAADYLRFQGEPFAEDDFEDAIEEIWDVIKRYDPAVIGCAWDDANPRIQLEPRGKRGYVELVPVKKA